MSKRISPEVKIVEFFRTQPLEVVKSVMAICQATVKGRLMEEVTTVAPIRRKRRQRRALGVSLEEKAAVLGDIQ